MIRIRMRFRPNEQGQSIVILALFFLFAFLVFAALSVDGTMIYLRRRQLQNMADAAVLAAAEQLSKSNDEAVAYQKAMDSIEENKGRVEWYSTSDPPDPPNTNVGSGLGLSVGIEITNACDVRVALFWSDMGTYFTQFFGRQTLQVGARAHASCSKVGGLQPIAVKRFGDEFDTDDAPPPPNTNNPTTTYCYHCNTRQPLPGQGNGTSFDFLRPESSDIITTWPTGTLMYQSPSPHADWETIGAGREYVILGEGVEPNVSANGTSYSGWVNLDIRHLSSPSKDYKNGTEGATSETLKDLAEYYIRRGYCCDIPKPGEEVATLSGVSTKFSTQAFQDTHNVGEIVAVIVYNGTVYKTPDLGLTGSPNAQSTHAITTTIAALNSAALTYTIRLEAKDGFTTVGRDPLTMDVEGLEGFADWSFSPTDRPHLPAYPGGPDVRFLTLHITPTVTSVGTTTQVITGTRMFYVSAFDPGPSFMPGLKGTDIKRYWAGIVTIGDVDSHGHERDLPAVTGTPSSTVVNNYPFVVVEQGKQARYNIDLDLWGGAGNQPVTVDFVGITPTNFDTNFQWVSQPPWTVSNVKSNRHPGASLQVNIKALDTATVNTIQELTLMTSAGTMTQTFKLYILVVPAGTMTAEDYVKILGYAALEVMEYPNVNAVRGRIVSRLMTDPNELQLTSRARLIPWEWDRP
jgi:hypothetical protein